MIPGKILVTGASGFVGSHLLPELGRQFPEAAVIASNADLLDEAAVEAEVASCAPDVLVHLAAVAAPAEARREPALAWRVNLGGTLTLAQAVLRAKPACLLVFASSADAYGASFAAGVALDEEAALAPLNTYGATKAAADLALGAMAAEGLRVVRLRAFNHTGPGQSDAFVVPAFARQIARIGAGMQAPVIEVGSLDAARDFLDVRDVCAAYAAAIAHAQALPRGAILNVASGRAHRIGDVLRDLLDLSGVQAEVRVDAARLRASEIASASGDASAAGRLLGWSPRFAWRQTLADVLADWRARAADGG